MTSLSIIATTRDLLTNRLHEHTVDWGSSLIYNFHAIEELIVHVSIQRSVEELPENDYRIKIHEFFLQRKANSVIIYDFSNQ